MKKNKGFKVLILIILIVVILLMIGIFFWHKFIDNKLKKVSYDVVDKTQVEVTDGVNEELSGYRNIVLLGIGDEYGYKGRSDCIIIFSINQQDKRVKMTSIYRDTLVEVPGHGYAKINEAYAIGKAPLAMSTINRNLDLNITDYVTINIHVVKDLVDAVGGVEIEVPAKEVKHISGITSAGTYNLTGEQALEYAGIRREDLDKNRTEKMRIVLGKTFSKIKQLSLIEINKIADKILPEIHTSIQESEIEDTIKNIESYSMGESMGWPYEVENKTIKGEEYVIPNTLQKSVQRLHEELFDATDYKTTEVVEKISNTIIKKTGVK